MIAFALASLLICPPVSLLHADAAGQKPLEQILALELRLDLEEALQKEI
jgi:hypothetical protein